MQKHVLCEQHLIFLKRSKPLALKKKQYKFAGMFQNSVSIN